MPQYSYYRGSRDSRETVEVKITRGSQYITTCVVNVDLLLCGATVFPCGNGDDEQLTPEQRLAILELVREERKKITDRYPVKTLRGWRESGLPRFEEFCSPGDEVDQELVDYFVNILPPIRVGPACTQAGEPVTHEKFKGGFLATYTTFHLTGDGRWKYDGCCFPGETVNRVEKTYCQEQFERRIEETRKEAQRHV